MKLKRIHTIIIILVCLAAYFQIAFFMDSLKWDELDAYLPMRYFVSACLRHNFFPLWMPYQGIGCPVYADLISTNSPETLLIGRLITYDNIVLHVVFMFYVIMAGIGIYKLALQLKIKPEIALILGIVYPLSGFFVGHAQHLQFVISGAWITFILLFYLKLLEEPKIRHLLLFIVFTFLQVSGGYPAHTIVLGYILIIIFVIRIIHLFRNRNFRAIFSLIGLNIIAMVILGVMCAGMYISIKQSLPYIARYNGLNYGMSIPHSFAPVSLVTLISPLTGALHPDLLHTDQSMNNIYFGIIPLLFFIYGIFQRKNFEAWFLLITGLVILCIAFGSYFFAHKLAYLYVPFFNRFRYPANLRLFVILSFLFFAGIQLSRYPIADKINMKRFKAVFLAFIGFNLFLFLFAGAILVSRIIKSDEFGPSFLALMANYGIYGPICLQTCINFLICLVLFLAIYRYNIKKPFVMITALVILETVLYTQLNAPVSIYYPQTSPRAMQAFLHHRPQGFPLPDNHSIPDNTDASVAMNSFWVNTNVYAKTVSSERVYPVVPNGLRLLSKDSLLNRISLNHPLLFLTDKVFPFTMRLKTDLQNNMVFMDDSLYKACMYGKLFSHSQGDTAFVTRLDPSGIEADITSKKEQLCILLQNNYSGWKAFINGKEVPHYTVNQTLIAVIVPAGESKLWFSFSNPLYIRTTFIAQSIFLLLVYLGLVFYFLSAKSNHSSTFRVWILTAIPFLLLVFLVFYPRESYADQLKKTDRQITGDLKRLVPIENKPDATLIFNVSEPDSLKKVFADYPKLFQRFRITKDLIDLKNKIDTLSSGKLVYIWHDALEIPGIEDVIRMKYPHKISENKGKNFRITLFEKGSEDFSGDIIHSVNDFEKSYPGWSKSANLLDSTISFSGKHSCRISPEEAFSSSFKYIFLSRPKEIIHAFASVKYPDSTVTNKSYLVITVNRHNKTLYYSAEKLDQFIRPGKIWSMAFAAQDYWPGMLKRGDELIVYCWNSGRSDLDIDDFQVTIRQ